MGIFSGSGVGKSTLLAMLARNSDADAIVIGLVGERGREVKEFIEDDLGAEGLARSRRRRRDLGRSAAGAPPGGLCRHGGGRTAARPGPECAAADGFGHPLRHGPARDRPVRRRTAGQQGLHAHRLRRTAAPAGTRRARACEGSQGSITGLFTVLVEGDDHNEPMADAVRGILDGHIVLERAIAERGPLSRHQHPEIGQPRHARLQQRRTSKALLLRARAPLTVYEDMAELIRLGAYKAGTNPEVDNAVRLYPAARGLPVAEERRAGDVGPRAMTRCPQFWAAPKGVRDEPDRYAAAPQALPRR